MKRVLKSKKGNGHFMTVIIVLVCLLIFAGTWEYMRVTAIARGVRESFQNAVTTVASTNLTNAYSDLREFAFDYESVGNSDLVNVWNGKLDKGEIMAELESDLKLTNEDGRYSRIFASGENEYFLSDLNVAIEKIDMNATDKRQAGESITRYVIEGRLTVTIYLSGSFRFLPPISKTISLYSGIAARY